MWLPGNQLSVLGVFKFVLLTLLAVYARVFSDTNVGSMHTVHTGNVL